jgi:hypothetical protein
MLRLVYLPANHAWAFIFGDDIKTASIISMAGHGRFFTSRALALEAAEGCEIQVNADDSCQIRSVRLV